MKPTLSISVLALALLAGCDRSAPAADAPAAVAPPVEDTVPPPLPPPPMAPVVSVPERFRGEWNPDPAACGTWDGDMRMDVAATEFGFYESRGTVRAVNTPSARELHVTLAMSGEGETWERSYAFRLSEGGRTLTDLDDEGVVRTRCP